MAFPAGFAVVHIVRTGMQDGSVVEKLYVARAKIHIEKYPGTVRDLFDKCECFFLDGG